MFRVQTIVFTLLFAFSGSLLASPNNEERGSFTWEDLEYLLNEFTEREHYQGYKGDIVRLKPSWTCDDRRYFWSVNWEATVGDVEIEFDPAQPDITKVRVELEDASLYAQYYRRGGFFCSWSGANGRLRLGRIFTTVTIQALPNKDFPRFDMEELVLKRMSIEDVDILFASVFNPGFKKASRGFADWVENNANSLIAYFLRSEAKGRIMDAINKKIRDKVDERLENGKDGQSADNSRTQLP